MYNKIRVYVAGPYTKGDVAQNVGSAMDAASVLIENGLYPYVPHLTHFLHMHHPMPYAYWLEYDKVFLETCDMMLVLPGASSGVQEEIRFANHIGRVIFWNIPDLLKYIRVLRTPTIIREEPIL